MGRSVYMNQLLRGYEIATGRETPSGDLAERIGHEAELLLAWHNASPEDREWVETSTSESDRFYTEQMALLEKDKRL